MSLLHKHVHEGDRVQRFGLYVLARYMELPFLWLSYRLFRGKWKWLGDRDWFRAIAGPLLFLPVAQHGDTAKPVPFREMLKQIDSVEGAIAVGPCRCRITNDGCDHPIETDIVIRTGVEAFTHAFPRDYRMIDKEEAKRIVTHCHELGMFHMLFYHCPSSAFAEYAICNCCPCGCAIHIANNTLGDKYFPLIAGEWVAVTDREACDGNGRCVEVCPFEVRAVVDGKVQTKGCIGCGLCEPVCPEKAIKMKRISGSGDNNGERF